MRSGRSRRPDRADRLLPELRIAVGQPLAQRRELGVGLRARVFGGDEHALAQDALRCAGQRGQRQKIKNRETSGNASSPNHTESVDVHVAPLLRKLQHLRRQIARI